MLGKVGAVAGAVVVALCWPLAVGQIGERIFQDTVGEYDSPYVSVTTESYDRGYLQSRAVSKIAVKSSWKDLFEEQGWPTEWQVAHEIHHGLFGMTADSTLVLDQTVTPQVHAWWGSDVVPLTLKTSTSLTRKTDLALTLNPFVYDDQEGNRFTTQPLTFTGHVTADGHSTFGYALKDAQLQTVANESMQLTGLQGGGLGYLDDGFWIGDQHLSVESLAFRDDLSEMAVQMNTIQATTLNQLTEAKKATEAQPAVPSVLNNSNQLSIGTIQGMDGQEYQNFNVELLFTDLNYDAITRLGVLSDDLEGELAPEQLEEIALALDLLVAKGLTFNLKDISLMAPEGPLKGNVRLTVQPGLARASQNLAQITSKLDGEIYFEVPSVLIDEMLGAASPTEQLVESGLLTLQDDKAIFSVKIEGDKVILANGDQLPLAMLMMFFLS
ncbi:DUF945 family protein [Photobacterium sp. GJ3]|uniref:DUF945 family protein n=1 Tax=Photobacterium sp. GJ3 TaxID=2829502 RepID=UPI001B8D67A7|nr:DUF945 family protein [Photobacterium sp. GJ3]QUJ66526.1 DUF945 family protein [Photobacterium sp. GJ3]